MKNIVFLDSYSVAGTSLAEIKQYGTLTLYDDTAPEDIVARCQDAEIVITNKVELRREEIESLPNLKLICVAATGVNNVDVDYARSHGVEVKNVAAYSTQSVAESTIAMVLALLRHVPFYNDFVHSGNYSKGGRCFNLDRGTSEILGKKWGIIAMGAIGQRVAGFATAFGAQVCYHSTSGKSKITEFPALSLEELLASCDIVSIHAPLTDTTEGLIGARELSMMKSSALLVNVGRGGIVDEKALAVALDEGVIAGAALDVFVNEPLEPNSPLLLLEDPYNLILAPHCGWSSAQAREVLIKGVAQNIAQFLK